jgi:hypothetical protein
VEPKARQSELIRQRHNVEAGQHLGGLLDIFRNHATAVASLVEDFQTAMSKAAEAVQCLSGSWWRPIMG